MSITLRPVRATDAVLSAILSHGHFCHDRYIIEFGKLFDVLTIEGLNVHSVGIAVAELINAKRIKWSYTRKSLVLMSELEPWYWAKCCYCHQRKRKMTRDHVQPRSKGGPDDARNIVFCCRQCNETKANRTPAQWAADTIRFRGGVLSRIKLVASVAVLAFVRQGGTS